MSISLVYVIPDPNRSDAEARKRAHQDLRRLSDFGLWRELHRLDWLKRLDTATLAALLLLLLLGRGRNHLLRSTKHNL